MLMLLQKTEKKGEKRRRKGKGSSLLNVELSPLVRGRKEEEEKKEEEKEKSRGGGGETNFHF